MRSAIPISFSGEAEFLAYIDSLLAVSAFSSNVKVTATDRIVSFCIVLPDGGDGRLLVSCKIVDSAATTIGGETTLAPAETTLAPAETTLSPEESPQG